MDARQLERLVEEAEELIDRLNAARYLTNDAARIAKIRHVRTRAWPRWGRRVNKLYRALEAS